MTKPTLPPSSRTKTSRRIAATVGSNTRRSATRKKQDNSDVLVSAVISTHLLTHLHQVLQRAEYGASKEGREDQAENFAQLRKVLCMDARSMKDASAIGKREKKVNSFDDSKTRSKAA